MTDATLGKKEERGKVCYVSGFALWRWPSFHLL
jgi:hypothetical protein